MATSSILGGERAPRRAAGRDIDALGPSDSSDTGSDVQGARGFDALDEGEIGGDRADLASDTDASGTGERRAAGHDTDDVEAADVAPDRIDALDAVLAGDADSLSLDTAEAAELAADTEEYSEDGENGENGEDGEDGESEDAAA